MNVANNQGKGENFPAAMIRGGGYGDTSAAGVFALFVSVAPSDEHGDLGFRCAR
jgi:hypothetical protein